MFNYYVSDVWIHLQSIFQNTKCKLATVKFAHRLNEPQIIVGYYEIITA